MQGKVIIIGEISENEIMTFSLKNKFKLEYQIISSLRKGLVALMGGEVCLVIINEIIKIEDTNKTIVKNQAILSNMIKTYRKSSEDAKAPIILTYNSESCPSPFGNLDYVNGLDNYMAAGANVCLSLQDNFNQKFIRAVSNYFDE